MLEIYVNGLFFRRLIDAVTSLVSQANFICTNEGIQFSAMDNSHVAFVDVNVLAPRFSQFRCDEKTVLGIDLKRLSMALQSITSESDEVRLALDPETENVLQIQICNKASANANIIRVNLCLIRLEQDLIRNKCDDKYTCDIFFAGKELRALVDTFKGEDFETVTFHARPSSGTESQGEGMNDQQVENEYEDDNAIKGEPKNDNNQTDMVIKGCCITISGDCNDVHVEKTFTQTNGNRSEMFNVAMSAGLSDLKEIFEFQYLKTFAKLSTTMESAKISLAKSLPLRLSYPIGDSSGSYNCGDGGYIKFYLAPRASDDIVEGSEETLQHVEKENTIKRTMNNKKRIRDEVSSSCSDNDEIVEDVSSPSRKSKEIEEHTEGKKKPKTKVEQQQEQNVEFTMQEPSAEY